MIRRDFIKIPVAVAAVGATSLPALPSFSQQRITLLNVSYDPTRELYVEFNQAFGRCCRQFSLKPTIQSEADNSV